MQTLNELRQEYHDLTDQINRAQKAYNESSFYNRVVDHPEHLRDLFAKRRTVNQILHKYYALEIGNAKSFLSWK